MSGGGEEGATLEFTTTWVVAAFCIVIVAISLTAERLLHYGGMFLKARDQKPLYIALCQWKHWEDSIAKQNYETDRDKPDLSRCSLKYKAFGYLDCFGDPQTIGKIGTDIEDFKCSWLIVKAFELSNEQQKKFLQENYGKPDPENVAKVKALYNELNLQGVFEEYESGSYAKLVSSIEAHPIKAVQAVLKSFLAKIYKRQK